MSNNIKISELTKFPGNPLGEDFIPIVDSSSMTTYRGSIGSILSASIPVWTVSSSVFASQSVQSTNSLYANYATRAGDVNIWGDKYLVPFWNQSGVNASLSAYSPLYISYSVLADTGNGILIVDKAYAAAIPWQPDPVYRPDYFVNNFWNYKQNSWGGWGSWAAGGIFTAWPIVSSVFNGTDQAGWQFSTASISTKDINVTNQFWSGSGLNGKWETIPVGNGGISSSFNKKWIRLASVSLIYAADVSKGIPSWISQNSAKGEVSNTGGGGGQGGLFGRVRFQISTNNTKVGSTNTQQVVDMHIHNQTWGGGISAQVFMGNNYSVDLIKKFRLSRWQPAYPAGINNSSLDPMVALDMYIDDLSNQDDNFNIECQSWGGVRFLETPNVDPPPLYDTASQGITDPSLASYLIFPPAAGYYTSISTQYVPRDYYIQGANVVINPNMNQLTESKVSNRSIYSLSVSGSINADKYYSGGQTGRGGDFVAYDPISSGWYNMHMDGGLLVASSSTTSPIVGNGVYPGGSYDISSSYASGSYTSSFAISASHAISSSYTFSSSYAITASQAITASYTTNAASIQGPSGIGAWGLIVLKNSDTVGDARPLFNYNVDHLTYIGTAIIKDASRFNTKYTNGSSTTGSLAYQWGYNYIVTLKNPMPTNNYVVLTANYSGYEPWALEPCGGYFNPFSERTTTQFTISFNGGDHNSSNGYESQYCGWFMVLSNV